MVITIISFKGGVGKSTIAQNLAVSLAIKGKDVCVLDADKNESTASWETFRNEGLPSVPVFHLGEKADIMKMINNLSKKYKIVIVDCPPSIEKITSKAVLKSNFSIIPVATTGCLLYTSPSPRDRG